MNSTDWDLMFEQSEKNHDKKNYLSSYPIINRPETGINISMSFGHTEEEIKTNNEDISSRKKFKSRIGNIHQEEEKKNNSLNNS